MATLWEAKNSLQTSSKVKVVAGVRRSLLLKVRNRADLFNLLFFPPPPNVKFALKKDGQMLTGCRGCEFGIRNSSSLFVFMKTGCAMIS